MMVCLSEVNLSELLPASLANVINAREGVHVLLCLHLGIYFDLPQMHTAPLGLMTGTIGVNQSLNLTLCNILSSRHLSSTSTSGSMVHGTGLALQNLALLPSFSMSFALADLSVSISS